MIESITIADVATFGAMPEVLDKLARFNFVFGANGTGKTTISRVIANESAFASCKVSWKGGTKLQPMAYNRDFVERNFNQSAELKGVFTLGEKHVDTIQKIATAKSEFDALTKKLETLTRSLQGDDGSGGKRGELVALDGKLKDRCWMQKQKHDPKLKDAFEGCRGEREKFKNKVLQEWADNVATSMSLADLEKKAETIFGPTPVTEQMIPTVEADKLGGHESNPILKKRIIGKDDVDIAAMIKILGNSDWVRQGRSFYDVNRGACPFCQQATPESFARSLNEYFDETFTKDSRTIDALVADYSTDSMRVQQQMASAIATQSKFLDIEKLKTEKALFDSKLAINIQRLAEKKKEPSQVVELEATGNVVAVIKALIADGNARVREHNQTVMNLSKERSTLKAQVWKFVLEELKADIDEYETDRAGIEKAIESINAQINEVTDEKAQKSSEIRRLEKQTTSIQPTIDEINGLLSSFGFQGFALAKTESGASYKLIRPNGSDAKATLSDGEKSFVTFLYFYHLLKGSESDTGMTTDRVVVFDDPVSSLDSDILFIVGSLIKGLLDDVRVGKGRVKQIFILTHNVYFHKEVTFNARRRNNEAMHNEETFWVVRKLERISTLENHKSNPIKTSYELLWSEVRRADRSNLTIQNTLRRILENYFKILGGIDPEKICDMFSGKEKLICRSLFSWVNDGSHFAHDDLYVSIDDSTVDHYLGVFKAIFDKSNHSAHYEMMMREDVLTRVGGA